MSTGKFGPNTPNPSVNETNTHTDQELESAEYRRNVETLKHAIRAAIMLLDEPADVGTFWSAIHEIAAETLESDKGPYQRAKYWSKLEEFSAWQMQQPLTGTVCVYDLHECSSSDCEIYTPCGAPAVGETDNGYGHGSYPYCKEHRP